MNYYIIVMESGLKLLKVTNNEQFQLIFNEGFMFARMCGTGVEGLVIAITIGLLDNLILAQATHANNFKFVEQK